MSGRWDRPDGPSVMDAQPGEPAPMAAPAVTLHASSLKPVRCECGHQVFDGEAIRSRCVKPLEGLALCRCKRWVPVPVQLVH